MDQLQKAQEKLLRMRESLGIVDNPQTRKKRVLDAPVFDKLSYENKKLLNIRQNIFTTAATTAATDATTTAATDATTTAATDATTTAATDATTTAATTITHPTLSMHMINSGNFSAYRLYLIFRCLDTAGSGLLYYDHFKPLLTTGKYSIYGRRRLNQVLSSGNNILWKQSMAQGKKCVRLFSIVRIMKNTGSPVLQGDPVLFPLNILIKSEQRTKAAILESFHSGRESAPISQQTICTTYNIPERTQRTYNSINNVVVTTNLAIDKSISADIHGLKDSLFDHASFLFFDHSGRQGQPKNHYIAYRLPNSYTGTMKTCSKRSRRRINKISFSLFWMDEDKKENKLFYSNPARSRFDHTCFVKMPGQKNVWHKINI